MSVSTWVEKMTVAVSRSSAMSARTSRRPSGSSELTGSSRTRSRGRSTSACAIPSRWRIPPEYPPIRRFAASDSPTRSSTSAARSRASVGRAAVQPRDHLDQLATAHPAVVARVLVEHADAEPAVRPCGIDPAVVDDDRAAGRPGESDEQPQGRGLAGPVRPEQTEHRSGRHIEVQPVERQDAVRPAVALREIADRDRRAADWAIVHRDRHSGSRPARKYRIGPIVATKMMISAHTTLLSPVHPPVRPREVVQGGHQQDDLHDDQRQQDRDEHAVVHGSRVSATHASRCPCQRARSSRDGRTKRTC